MNDRVVRKERRRRLYLAAVPSTAVLFVVVWSVLTMTREFTWSGLLLVLLIPPATVLAISTLAMRLRTERRLTAVRITQYQALRDLFATTAGREVTAWEYNVVFLPLVGGRGVVRVDRGELADATWDRRAAATVVGERFWLETTSPQVAHDFTTVTPLADATTDVTPLARPASSSFWSPCAWWRDLRTDWAVNRSGVTVPTDADVDILITQLRTATT